MQKKVLFISSYVPGVIESIGYVQDNAIIGWPAIFHTINGFVKASWLIDWIVLSEKNCRLKHNERISIHFVKIPILRYFLGFWRRRWLWRLSGLAALILNTIWVLPSAAKIIRSRKPDLVYCFCESSILAGSILRAIFGVKVVNRILGAQALSLGVWKKRTRLALFLQDPEYISQFIAPADLKVITNDGSSGKELALLFRHIHRSRVLFAFNGVSFSKIVRSQKVKNCLQIGTFARLVHWKRVDILMYVMNTLVQRGIDIRLLIVGYGAEEPNLRGLGLRLGLTEKIIWLGQLKHTASIKKMSQCDIVIITHQYCNLPNTLWEAMALGKCIIGVDDPGTRGILTHRENAYLVKQKFTANDLASAIEYLFHNPQEIKRVGDNARTWARANTLSWEERISTEIEFIEKEILH